MARIFTGGALTFLMVVFSLGIEPANAAYGPKRFQGSARSGPYRYVYLNGNKFHDRLQRINLQNKPTIVVYGQSQRGTRGPLRTNPTESYSVQVTRPTSHATYKTRQRSYVRTASFEESPLRIWTNKAMTKRLEARMVAFDGKRVTLVTAQGERATVSLDYLSQFDRKFVKNEISR